MSSEYRPRRATNGIKVSACAKWRWIAGGTCEIEFLGDIIEV